MRVFGIVGWKNSGKTTLTERLVTEIAGRGFAVSTIKHAHHGFDVDQAGTDSYRHRKAGAREVLISSSRRWALMHELEGEAEPALPELLSRLAPADLVLVEGFKNSANSKIEVRWGDGLPPPVALADPQVRALVSPRGETVRDLPVFDPDDIAAISAFVLRETGLA